MIPKATRQALRRYGEDHKPTGGFLYAVLCNRFVEACARADEPNRKALDQIARLVYETLPSESWGSPDAVDKWLSGRMN